MKIGLTYIKGSLPGFEDFGNLPTNLVKSNGLVDGTNGVKASDELDGIIIPGGSILESNSISDNLAKEIKIMANDGKFVIGICSGFQALANQTDVGRKSPCPIIKKGLGLLDVNFSPLISNDRVEVKVVNDSFLTDNKNNKNNDNNNDNNVFSETITGFHCHTYGNIRCENEIPIFYSSIKRMNYKDTEKSVLSGVRNDNGNVIGTLVHGILDENPSIVENIFDYIGADFNDIDKVFAMNGELKKTISSELAINTGINIKNIKACNEFRKIIVSSLNNKSGNDKSYDLDSIKHGIPPMLMIGATGSDSGKTFITTGIAGALTKRGLNVCVLKVGPDVRDTESALYLTKNKMEEYASIKIGHLGWVAIEDTLKRLRSSNYDFVIVEGVMSVFTGLLNEKIPYSGAEIAASSNIPMLLVSGVSKGGIESTAVDLVSHSKTLAKMGIKVNGIILNKVYDMNIFNEVAEYVATNSGEDLSSKDILTIPKIKLDERSSTPEVEIKFEEFSKAALDTVEKHLDLEKIVKMADIPKFKGYLSFDKIKSFFN
jgi:cobyric acid synthase